MPLIDCPSEGCFSGTMATPFYWRQGELVKIAGCLERERERDCDLRCLNFALSDLKALIL